MIEKVIYFDNIDPVEFCGAHNTNIDRITRHFSKVKLVIRGTAIKITGSKNDVSFCEEKLKLIIDYISRNKTITDYQIDRILLEDGPDILESATDENGILLYGASGKPIRAFTPNQRKMVEEIKSNDMLFAIGPAGSGKTYTAIALAVRALKNREVKKIILSRPAVEAGENLGYLPGDLKEKLDPYLQPLYDALQDMIPNKKIRELQDDGVIEIAPLAFMRGRTLDNAFVILDEAQNATVNQLKMFLTRMGRSAKFIITGDITQIDLPKKQNSGLVLSAQLLKNITGISIIEFDARDITRHRLVKQIVDAYETLDDENKVVNKI
jgi:phosphate starvation-inducible protein PhoH and related proteins